MESKRQQEIRRAIKLIGKVSSNEWEEFWKLEEKNKEKLLSSIKSAYAENFGNFREKEIKEILDKTGFHVKNNGYKYLVMAISLYAEDSTRYSCINDLYKEVSAYYGNEYLSVERCIRWAIETTWVRMPMEQKNEAFAQFINSPKGKPTNKEFIKRIIEMLG